MSQVKSVWSFYFGHRFILNKEKEKSSFVSGRLLSRHQLLCEAAWQKRWSVLYCPYSRWSPLTAAALAAALAAGLWLVRGSRLDPGLQLVLAPEPLWLVGQGPAVEGAL